MAYHKQGNLDASRVVKLQIPNVAEIVLQSGPQPKGWWGPHMCRRAARLLVKECLQKPAATKVIEYLVGWISARGLGG